ncbi:MAG: hypothetical protein JKX84_08460 [Flavobacteriales bacterium]|nr:hypothetical protein [Flavobacteriales bacterium]
MSWKIRLTAFFLSLFSLVSAQQVELIAPTSFISGKAYPFALEAMTNGQVDLFRSEVLSTTTIGGQIANGVIKIKKGRGLATVQVNSPSMLLVTATGISLVVNQNENQPILHNGTINGSTTWLEGTVHHISSDLLVATGDTLTIEAGCWVLIDSAVNMIVNGMIKAEGTRENPISFCSNSEASSWGGILINQGVGAFEYCLFINGGGDVSQAFGHSNSQATVKTNGGPLNLDHCFIFDCQGKGIGAENATIQFSNGAISRCDMGGDFIGSTVSVIGSHVLDIPNDDGIFVDDDNDGFYFSGANQQETSIVDSCVFMIGKDDAIDHNNAILEVRNTWVEGFENEGIAASNGNSVFVYNSLFKNCEQGIEAGYGSPQVIVDHCVMIGNDNGLRFGDWYDWGSNGSIACTNSIMADNVDNIYNFDVLANGPISGAIELTYSLTNDVEYDNNTGCLAGQPIFNSNYLLEPGSPGVGLGNDGLNMGLIASIPTGISENSGLFGERMVSFRIFDLKGAVVLSGNNSHSLVDSFSQLKNGIYLVQEVHETGIKKYKKAIFK